MATKTSAALLLLTAMFSFGPSATQAAPAIDATAVVALIDTGINPYHEVFRDDSPRAYRHPSTYIEGFPRDAKALKITLDAASYEEAIATDCDRVWASVKPGELYWFPGTKIVGGIATSEPFLGFEFPPEIDCSSPNWWMDVPILDNYGHGTMVASRAAGKGYGACSDCRLVAIEGLLAGVEWAGKNAHWIDVQSNSWGSYVPGWSPIGATGDQAEYLFAPNSRFVRTVEAAARAHLAFWATGNGVLTRAGVLGHPTILDPRMTPSIVMVGGHDSGYVTTWTGWPPHVVSDACDSWAAIHNHLDRSSENVGGGTSGATPFAAGGAAQIVLWARQQLGDRSTGVTKDVVAEGRKVGSGPLEDGRFTLEEWKSLTFKTATERPEAQREDGPPCRVTSHPYGPAPMKWNEMPEEYPEYLHIGYGAVDRPALDRAQKVLQGAAAVPDRADTDAYFAVDRQIREALHAIYSRP